MTFSTDIIKNINLLPEDIVTIILAYIPNRISIFLQKDTYLMYHSTIKNYINKRNFENYIRTMIRQDNDFVLNLLLQENYQRWLNMKKYYYRTCIYSNYITFLQSYAIDHDSKKCKKTIANLMKELGLSKNQHKKKTFTYIRWKT